MDTSVPIDPDVALTFLRWTLGTMVPFFVLGTIAGAVSLTFGGPRRKKRSS